MAVSEAAIKWPFAFGAESDLRPCDKSKLQSRGQSVNGRRSTVSGQCSAF
jgi:hypothetical protein